VPCVEEQTRLSIKNILLATVFSGRSEAILSYAVRLARHYGSKMSLAGAVSARTICEIVKNAQIDFVVVGTQAQESRKSDLDTAVKETLRIVPCPMLIIGPRVTQAELTKEELERIVYVTDCTLSSLRGLPYTLALAQDHNAQLNFVHVPEETTMGPFHFGSSRIVAFRKRLESLVAQGKGLLQESEFNVQEGDRAERLVRIASNLHASLVVMTAPVTSETSASLLGALGVQVLRLALCPVLIVRGSASQHSRRQAP